MSKKPLNKSVLVGLTTVLCPCLLQNLDIKVKDSEYYFLKDDVQVIPMDSGDLRSECLTSRIQSTNQHTILNANFGNQGSYQCVYHPKGISPPIKSPKWFLQVTGVN